jgi:hypothetical protein
MYQARAILDAHWSRWAIHVEVFGLMLASQALRCVHMHRALLSAEIESYSTAMWIPTFASDLVYWTLMHKIIICLSGWLTFRLECMLIHAASGFNSASGQIAWPRLPSSPGPLNGQQSSLYRCWCNNLWVALLVRIQNVWVACVTVWSQYSRSLIRASVQALSNKCAIQVHKHLH